MDQPYDDIRLGASAFVDAYDRKHKQGRYTGYRGQGRVLNLDMDEEFSKYCEKIRWETFNRMCAGSDESYEDWLVRMRIVSGDETRVRERYTSHAHRVPSSHLELTVASE